MIIVSIAILEASCLDPGCLRIDQSLSPMMDAQTPCDISNRSPRHLAGNDEYLAILQQLVEDEMRVCSESEPCTQFHSVEGHDPMDDVPGESFATTVGQESPEQDDSSELSLDRTLQINSLIPIQREPELFDGNDQDLQSEDLTQADDRQHNLRKQVPRMDVNENNDINSEDFEVRNRSKGRGATNTYFNADHLQVEKRKYSLKASGQSNCTRTPKRTRPSQFRTAGLATRQDSSIRHAMSCKEPFLETEKACLESYISQYKTKYRELGLACPGELFSSRESRKRLASLGLDNYAKFLRVLSFTIGDYESLLGLKEILRVYRDPNISPLISTQEAPNAKRLEAIRSLEIKGAYINLIKKCHIHRLFTDNIDPLRNPNDNFIVRTTYATENSATLATLPKADSPSRRWGRFILIYFQTALITRRGTARSQPCEEVAGD